MQSAFHVSPRFARRMVPILVVAAVVAGFAFGGPAWLLMAAALFLLGRSYGSRSELQEPAGHAEYGIGAALAGFTPVPRK